MIGQFDSAWLKWGRAVHHAQVLEMDIEQTSVDSQVQPFGTFRLDYEPQRHGFSLRVDTIQTIPVRWTLLLGDVVGNFRASLDHLAWALVKRGRTPNLTPKQERDVGFPIAMNAGDLRGVLGGQRPPLPGVRRADLAIVRRYQPYHRGVTRVPWHCFRILSGLVNADKHREIRELWMVPEILELGVIDYRDCAPIGATHKGFRVVMDVDTEVALIRVRKTGPKPHIQVKYDVTSYPAFHPRLWLQHWMDVTTVTILNLLSEFAEMPPQIETLSLDASRLAAAFQAFDGHARLTFGSRRPFPAY